MRRFGNGMAVACEIVCCLLLMVIHFSGPLTTKDHRIRITPQYYASLSRGSLWFFNDDGLRSWSYIPGPVLIGTEPPAPPEYPNAWLLQIPLPLVILILWVWPVIWILATQRANFSISKSKEPNSRSSAWGTVLFVTSIGFVLIGTIIYTSMTDGDIFSPRRRSAEAINDGIRGLALLIGMTSPILCNGPLTVKFAYSFLAGLAVFVASVVFAIAAFLAF